MDERPVALVTGASRGIGRAIAVMLAGEGYRPVITARSTAALEETASLCIGGDAVVVPLDLTAEEAPETLMDRIAGETGRLDVLVNNAGAALSRSFDETETADWDRMMAVNARGPFVLTRAALPLLRRSPAAAIINIGSVVSFKGYEKQAAYAASKHALAGWTKVLAKEVAGEGIRVHLIAPGGVATEMVRGVRPDIDAADLIAPEEIAEAVRFLVNYRGNGVIDLLGIHRAGKEPFA